MADNHVQFPKIISIHQFMKAYGTEALICFLGVKEAKSVHYAVVTGVGAERETLPYFKWINTMIINGEKLMYGTYHAIANKYLLRYLAEFCFRFNRRFYLE